MLTEVHRPPCIEFVPASRHALTERTAPQADEIRCGADRRKGQRQLVSYPYRADGSAPVGQARPDWENGLHPMPRNILSGDKMLCSPSATAAE